MHVTQNWTNLVFRPPVLQLSSKLSDFFFFWWKISQIVFFFLCSLAFGCILFLLRCDIWKMDDLFQRPLGTVLRFEVKVAVWDFNWMFQKLPKLVLICSLDLYWMYFVQIQTSCYIKMPNFVLNTWVPHNQIDQRLRFISEVVMKKQK